MTTALTRQAPIKTLLDNGAITQSHLDRLLTRGYSTVGAVALIADPVRIGRALGISSRDIVHIVHTAQKRSQLVIRKRPLRLLPGNPIWFDIETDMHWKRVWLIGALDETEDRVHQFYADNWDCEYDMLLQFDQFLRDRPNKPLFYYSCNGFDVKRIRESCIRLGLTNHAIFTHPELDICQPLRKSFFIPTPNRKLKTLAAFLGFDLSLEGREGYMDGKECAEHYEQHAMFKTPLDPNVFVYNANDVHMLPFIVNRLNEIAIDQK